MSTESIEVNDTPQITEPSTTTEPNASKASWCTKIRDSPVEMEKFRQKRRERYQALKLIRESLPPDERPEKNQQNIIQYHQRQNVDIILNIIAHIKKK